MDHVLQERLPTAPWMAEVTRRLPGLQPLDPAQWLIRDEAYGGQMAERVRLLSELPETVHALRAEGVAAAAQLRAEILGWLEIHDAGFQVQAERVICPDGREVKLSDAPLRDLGLIVQEDFCLLLRPEGEVEHLLAGAVLCFPASWSLDEKLGRPLTAIHGPVKEYTDDMAVRVQRMFDAVHVGRPLWRQNALIYSDPTLFQPRREAAPRIKAGGGFLRSERQGLWRLPVTGAVVFSIHTYVLALTSLTAEQRSGLAEVAHVT